MTFVQHGIRLARSGRRAEVDAQATAPVRVALCSRLNLLIRRNGRSERSLQVAIAQAIAPQEFLRIGPPLLTFPWLFLR
jgi:hypothetical protein